MRRGTVMLCCGLLGEKLGYSYSPAIHALLGDYEYRLFEVPPEELGSFLRETPFHGLNVTIPYKKAVVPYCAELSETAQELGSVNTLLRREDGSLYGDNTDDFGFREMLRDAALDPRGKKALVFGSGGASAAVCHVLHTLGADPVVVVSRTGEDNYGNLDRHADAGMIVNATPVGSWPGNGASPTDLRQFPALEGVADLIYNPARTALLLQAEELGIPYAGGLYMLAAQALRSSEIFQGRALDTERIGGIVRRICRETENIILIGMPGCGKSTVAAALGAKLGRPVTDVDELIVRRTGKTIPEIFRSEGESGFRRRESEVLGELGKKSGQIIATGGGCVTRPENYPLLHQNGTIFWLKRDTEILPRCGRPLSTGADLEEMYRVRAPLYERFADHVTENDRRPEDAAERIWEALL